MTDLQWNAFCDFKVDFKKKIEEWTKNAPELLELQKTAAKLADTPDYSFETPVVYNCALDEILKEDEIKLIVIGDNPGKDEQLLKNNKYLVGQAGKIAEGYFKRNPELDIDFRKNVIILNKTPIHSAKTGQLKTIAKLGGEKISRLIDESQIWMAKRTARLHIELCKDAKVFPELWMVGYSELNGKGIFVNYRNVLKSAYDNDPKIWDKVFVFQHFSMNRFSIDLKDYMNAKKNPQSLENCIHELGLKHKSEIF